ncbi:MAG: NAD(P)H-hydrate epimerase [Planctomycetota bacterium]
MRAVTREEMREMDRRAIEDYGIPGIVLMENAGCRTAEEILKMLRDPTAATVFIFCGKGNNGGDGFVVARHLHNHGIKVQTFVTFKIDDVKETEGDAATNLRIALNMKLPISEVEAAADLPALRQADLIVDGLLGTGLSGEVREPLRGIIEAINASGVPVVAIDIPSGLCANTGRVLGVAVRAKKTVTFACPKKGFQLADGPEYVGELVVAEISIPREVVEGA